MVRLRVPANRSVTFPDLVRGEVTFHTDQIGDPVLVRSDGQPTYYATDIAYHYDKFVKRGFDRVVDI